MTCELENLLMRFLVFFIVASFTPFAFSSQAQASDEKANTENDQKGSLDLVPLVNKEAPRIIVKFWADNSVPIADASAVEDALNGSLYKRMDIRVLTWQQVYHTLARKELTKLKSCTIQDLCLMKMGLAVEAFYIVRVIMRKDKKGYRLDLKCFNFDSHPPSSLDLTATGTLAELLMTGSTRIVDMVLSDKNSYEPLNEETLARLEEPATQAKPARPIVAEIKPVKSKTSSGTSTKHIYPALQPSLEEKSAEADYQGFFGQHLWSTATMGSGTAMLITAIVLGSLSDQIESDISVRYDKALDERGQAMSQAANAFYIASGVSVAASLVLFFFFEDENNKPGLAITPSFSGSSASVEAVFEF